jgi:hypothetical protein
MRPAAQFERVVLDAHGPDLLAVLLVEEGVGPGGDGLRHRLHRRGHGPVLADDAAHFVLDCALLVGCERSIAGVVETQVIRRHERPCLVRLGAQHVAQGAVEKVRRGVIAHRPGTPVGVDSGGNRLPHSQPAVQLAPMDEQAGDWLLGVLDREERAAAAGFEQLAAVPDLAASLAVEGCGVEDDLGFAAAGQFLVFHAVPQDRHDAGLDLGGLVAEEPGLAGAALDRLIEVAQLGVAGQIGFGALAAARLLLGHGRREALAIDPHAVFGGHVHGEIHREAVGVVEPERDFAAQDRGRRRAGCRAAGLWTAPPSSKARAPPRDGWCPFRGFGRIAPLPGGSP